MASGADFVKGTFTTDTAYTYKVDFGKTFSKYLYYIEMTDDSKTALMNSGQSSAKMFACFGVYPPTEFDSSHSAAANYMSYRIKPSDSTIDCSSSAAANQIDGSSVTLGLTGITGGANSLYREYSYNYYVVEIK